MKLKNKKFLYWIIQVSGWTLYVALAATYNYLQDRLTDDSVIIMVLIFLLGITLTHIYRNVIVRLKWLELSIQRMLPRIFLAAILYGLVFYLVEASVIKIALQSSIFYLEGFLSQLLNWFLICCLWSFSYLAFHFFNIYRKEEIKNLRWEATSNEVELSNLKSQLNPHFMFNSMNSIRALIDENPEAAKKAITRLSNILRSTLLMGKKKFVWLKEEMHVVGDYLLLEGVRHEERLRVHYDLEEGALQCFIPPLMVQTIVENAIKHGISQLPQGGDLRVEAVIRNENLIITISNSGKLQCNASETGIGLSNTRKRLQLLYSGQAKLKIFEKDAMVITKVELPKQIEHEGHYH